MTKQFFTFNFKIMNLFNSHDTKRCEFIEMKLKVPLKILFNDSSAQRNDEK